MAEAVFPAGHLVCTAVVEIFLGIFSSFEIFKRFFKHRIHQVVENLGFQQFSTIPDCWKSPKIGVFSRFCRSGGQEWRGAAATPWEIVGGLREPTIRIFELGTYFRASCRNVRRNTRNCWKSRLLKIVENCWKYNRKWKILSGIIFLENQNGMRIIGIQMINKNTIVRVNISGLHMVQLGWHGFSHISTI